MVVRTSQTAFTAQHLAQAGDRYQLGAVRSMRHREHTENSQPGQAYHAISDAHFLKPLASATWHGAERGRQGAVKSVKLLSDLVV